MSKDFYNTTSETGEVLKDYQTKAKGQKQRILEFFKSNPARKYSAEDIQSILIDPDINLKKVASDEAIIIQENLHLFLTGRMNEVKFIESMNKSNSSLNKSRMNLNSVRRAMTDLTTEGHLEALEDKVIGLYGHPVFLRRLK